jgi:hypothetical protein
VRVTAIKIIGALAEVHLGIDQGPTATAPLCGEVSPARTTVTEAANCGSCITRARAMGLSIEGLVAIPEEIRRLINAVRVAVPEAAELTNSELAELLQSCPDAASAVAKLRPTTEETP